MRNLKFLLGSIHQINTFQISNKPPQTGVIFAHFRIDTRGHAKQLFNPLIRPSRFGTKLGDTLLGRIQSQLTRLQHLLVVASLEEALHRGSEIFGFGTEFLQVTRVFGHSTTVRTEWH